jgi:hypothetical protein
MAGLDDLCTPFNLCDDLGSSVLIQRTAYGPSLVNDLASLPFGELALQGAAVRPFVDLFFGVRWVPRDLCYGPIASVTTLAPGETVVLATRTEHRTSFTNLVRDAADSSSVSTNTRQDTTTRQGPPGGPLGFFGLPGGSGGAGGFFGSPGGVSSASQSGVADSKDAGRVAAILQQLTQSKMDTVELRPHYAKGYGSFLDEVVDTFVGVATGGASLVAGAVAGSLHDVVKHGVGAKGQPGPVVSSTVSTISEIIDSITRQESQSHLSEAAFSTEDSTVTSVTRSFTNPYRDRTLQLRFMPVFRRFDVVTSLIKSRLGLAMICGHVDFSSPNLAIRYSPVLRNVVTEPTILQLAHTELGATGTNIHAVSGALQDHLQANAGIYTKRFLSAAASARDDDTIQGAFNTLISRNSSASPGNISEGLAWFSSEARANTVHVPIASFDTVKSAWALDAVTAQQLSSTIDQISPAGLAGILGELPPQTVHLYAGSHIEAVAGHCLLSGIISDALSVQPPDED